MLPGTSRYFDRNAQGRGGLKARCKACVAAARQEFKIRMYEIGSEERAEPSPQSVPKQCKYCERCCNLPHRREKPRCRKCREPFEEDQWRQEIAGEPE